MLTQARNAAQKTTCLSNMRQMGMAFMMYMDDQDGLMPDRRDLKAALPLGYRPWTSWPPSDPRAGWFVEIARPYTKWTEWSCPSAKGVFAGKPQVRQQTLSFAGESWVWMWRFDRNDPSVIELDNFWGKSIEGAIADLQAANNPAIGQPEGPSQVELAVDPFFPSTIPSVDAALKGRTSHFAGRNRLHLDGSVRFINDARTRR